MKPMLVACEESQRVTTALRKNGIEAYSCDLKPTNIVEGREQRLHYLPPSKNRAELRSKTFQGIADALGYQYSEYLKGENK